ncbi:hypothetical protein LUZ60_014156 [Juncus effusus]|nr:hypothetical protein LUZ60_014156 [Juncus effusus]
MADIKGFYRQKKNKGVGVSKPASSSKKSKHSTGGASLGASGQAQTPALISRCGSLDLKGEFGEEEEVLRQFDMNMKYGPCIGVDRMDRWERASVMGLNPPEQVKAVLEGAADRKGSMTKLHCLWEGLV